MFDIIAVDISGRHKVNDEYLMVCAAVAASVTADHIEKVNQINLRSFRSKSAPDVQFVVKMVETTVSELKSCGTIVTEAGDFYNKPQWLIDSMFTGISNIRNHSVREDVLRLPIMHHSVHESFF